MRLENETGDPLADSLSQRCSEKVRVAAVGTDYPDAERHLSQSLPAHCQQTRGVKKRRDETDQETPAKRAAKRHPDGRRTGVRAKSRGRTTGGHEDQKLVEHG
jgi:hypothetical protein